MEFISTSGEIGVCIIVGEVDPDKGGGIVRGGYVIGSNCLEVPPGGIFQADNVTPIRMEVPPERRLREGGLHGTNV